MAGKTRVGQMSPHGWVHDPAPDGLGLPRRSVVSELYLVIYEASKDGVGTWGAPMAEAARTLGCSSRTVQRAVARLTADALVYQSGTIIAKGQRGGSPVRCYSASLRRVRQVRSRRRDAALAGKRLGLPYDEEDTEWIDGAAGDGEDTAAGDSDSLTKAQKAMLDGAIKCGVLSSADATAVARLMAEAPVPVDDAHMEPVIEAYAQARDDGFAPEDMLRAVREYRQWAAGREDPPTTYLYVLLMRNGGGAHHKALEWARRHNLADGEGSKEESQAGAKASGNESDASAVSSPITEANAAVVARELNKMSRRYAGHRMPELVEAVRGMGTAVRGGCTGDELVSAYRWYMGNGGRLDYALAWLRGTDDNDKDCAWWCVAHLRLAGKHGR